MYLVVAKTDITKGNYYEREPLNLILAIYNAPGNYKTDKVLKAECMDMFDKMLQQSRHRSATNVVI